MADYGTTYVFRIDIEGKEAVAAAAKLRKDLDVAITSGQATAREVDMLRRAYQDLAEQTDYVGDSITSTTRRMTYQRKGMKETEASILSLGTHYQTLFQLMDKAGTEPFTTMIQAALKMKDELVGHSIIPDMVYEAIRYFQTLRSYGVGTFEAIVQSAQPLQRFSETMSLNVPGMATVPQPDPDVAATGTHPFKDMAEGAKIAARETGKVTTEMDKLNAAINEATIQHFGMRRIGYGLAYSGRVIARAGEALTGALMGTSEAYLQFEQRATIAGIAMEMQTQQIDDLEKAVLDTSVALALFKPEELLEGTRQWAAGTGAVIENQEQLNELLGETIDIQKMAALNSVDLSKSVDTVGGVMHEFGLETKDVTHITEVLNFVAAKTFANVLDVGDAFKMVGPIASQLGISMEEVAVTIGLVSDANIKGSRAGRALRQMFQRLLKPTREYDEMMQNLLKGSLAVGETWQDLIMPGGVFVGMAEYFDILAKATEGYTSAERAAALATLATANELPALVHLVERTIELRREGKSLIDEELNAVLDAHGLMTRSFETLEESESYRVEQMKRRWESATLEMGGAVQKNMLPYMEAWYDLITGIVEGLTENPEVLKWLALSGFGLQGVGTAVGGLGEAINIGANIAIMSTAIDKFGGFTEIFKIAAGGLLAGLKWLLPLAALAGTAVAVGQVVTSKKELEEKYPEDVQKQVQQMTYFEERTGRLYAKGVEMRAVFQDIFGQEWTTNSIANVERVYDALAPMLGPAAATAEPAGVGAMPDWSTLTLPATAAATAMPNESEALMQYLEYLERISDITEAYYERRQDMIDDSTAREWDALQAYMLKEEERTEKHYLALSRAAEDYQISLERLESSHLMRMEDLIGRRDARGMLREVRSYEERRVDLGEDYEKSRSRRIEDYELQREAAKEQYYLLREARAEALQTQLIDLEVAWQAQLVALEEAEQEKLAALIGAETKQEAYLREHYATILEDFKLFLSDYDAVWQQFANTSLDLTPAILDRMHLLALVADTLSDSRGVKPAYSDWEKHRIPEGMQEGGYADAGIYTLGETGREFVLSAPTTQAAERQLGAPLGQASFGGLGGSEIVVNQSNWQFNGTFTEGDKEWFRSAAKEAAYEGIVEVVRG